MRLTIMNLSSDWAARTALSQGNLNAQLSVQLSSGSLPLYLNVEAGFIEDENRLTLDALRIGRMAVPKRFLQFTPAAPARQPRNRKHHLSEYQ